MARGTDQLKNKLQLSSQDFLLSALQPPSQPLLQPLLQLESQELHLGVPRLGRRSHDSSHHWSHDSSHELSHEVVAPLSLRARRHRHLRGESSQAQRAGRTAQPLLQPEPSSAGSQLRNCRPVERSESFDGSPQPLAVESIAKTSARLELIIALIPARADSHSRVERGRCLWDIRRGEAGFVMGSQMCDGYSARRHRAVGERCLTTM